MAVEDLGAIWDHVAQDSPAAADLLIDGFTATFELLRTSPFIGIATPELDPEMRRFPTGQYVEFYAVEEDRIVIRRVLHGARDIAALFG